MPRKAIDYSKTHFYKLVCKDTSITDCYVGHTTEFTKRKNQHKCNCNNQKHKEYNYYVYQFMRSKGNWDNWEMILINTEYCNNNMEARQRERYYKEQLNSSLNVKHPFRPREEYYIDNSEELKQKSRDYYENNPEKVKETNRIYRENNKEAKSERDKKWREKNDEKLKLKRRVKTTCECGATVSKMNLPRHLKSQAHQNYIKSLQD